jgi:zinc transporter ZupT
MIGIFVHEIIQETSEFFVLKEAGFSTKKALLVNLLVSSTILIGSVGSYFLIQTFESIESILLALAAGSFLIVVIYDLIPHSIRTSSNRTHYIKHLFFFMLGILIMFGINTATSGSHSHDHGESENHSAELHDEHDEQII